MEYPDSFASALTGNWSGVRTTALQHGIRFDIANSGDLLANSRGVRADIRYANLLETAFTADIDTLAGWPGGTLYIMAIASLGGDSAETNGSISAPSNLTAADGFKLFEAWYEQSVFDDRVGILAGLYAVDSEFDVKGTADVFLNGAFGTGLDLSETGINGPSVFPVTSLGVRVRANLSQEVTVRVAVLDGVPGDPNDSSGTQISLKGADGLLIMSEINYQPEQFDFLRFGLGSWLYTAEFKDLLDTYANGDPVRRNGTYGVYGFVEGVIFTETEARDQGLSAFLRMGGADEDVNQIARFYGAGLVYTGLIPNRDDDIVGLGIAVGVNGEKYKRARQSGGVAVRDAEIALELTYRAQLMRWFSFQPVLQYYINPGANPALNDSLVGGFRYSINF
ncbi:carbohydrate porin [Methylomarinum vadi]|uniref:carbohydrate porin n=1 Tax=Methylomarinum vadi TaxID=438855 RepID=UPI0013634846|nr:carbohydrate porin [Methylomarinum vadi]